MDRWLFVLTLIAAVASGMMGGAFYAFSSFVMRALARVPAREGIVAMQSINVEAPTAPFMAGFLGTALLSIALVVVSFVEWGESYAVYLLLGGLVYLIGTIVLTLAYHVPRNNALAALDAESERSAEYWGRYLREWTAMNHVRMVAGLVAAGLLIGAIRVG